jgi:predicted nuclease of restriction endonuclease-like (RecB) superfamily
MKQISNNQPDKRIAGFIDRVRSILSGARQQALAAVNSHMLVAYWNVGREIVEEEQKGKARAGYGDRLVENLAEKLSGEFGSSISKNNLWYMRQFYLTYLPQVLKKKLHALRGESKTKGQASILHALRGELTWTHYRLLLSVENQMARDFYEAESVKARWSTRELERQIASQLHERLLMSRDKEGILHLAKRGHEPNRPADLIKDPYVLEFTGLPERELLRENDLESALIEQMKNFLLELGRGFSFVARQKRITLDGDHHWIDLVFYHIPLRRYVLIELKTGKLTHQDIGQLQMYVNYYDRQLRESGTDKTIGILLCARKNDAVVKFTLPKNNRQIFASKYQLYFPTREELTAELERERKVLERQLGNK